MCLARFLQYTHLACLDLLFLADLARNFLHSFANSCKMAGSTGYIAICTLAILKLIMSDNYELMVDVLVAMLHAVNYVAVAIHMHEKETGIHNYLKKVVPDYLM